MKRKYALFLILLTVVFFSLYGCTSKKKISLETVYVNVLDGESDSLYMSLANDSSYISVDTNPFDIEDWTGDSLGIVYIKSINEELGLTDAVWEEISSIRALDGRKSITENGILITYSYHPDSGLKVVYKLSND